VLYYNLPKLSEDEGITLEITDEKGGVVNTYSSTKDAHYLSYDGGPPSVSVLSTTVGLNRFVWDMRYPTMPGIPHAYIEGSYRGHKVSPGKYTITLKKGDEKVSVVAEVKDNPLYETNQGNYQAYHAFMMEMEKTFTDMINKVNRLQKVRNQLTEILAELPEEEKFKGIKLEGQLLIEHLKNWDEDMIQRKSKAYDDVENFPNKFTANYLYLINQTESSIPKVTKGSKDLHVSLTAEWKGLNERALKLIETEIPAFNKKLWEAGIGALQIPD